MGESEEARVLATMQRLAEIAGLPLSQEELAKLKPAYDLVRAEVAGLREGDLGEVEPALTFAPDWT